MAENEKGPDRNSPTGGDKKDKPSASTGKRVKGFFRKVVLYLLLLLVLAGAGYYVFASWTYSSGTRSGYLVKISRKGYLFKTYEGQLNLGGFQEGEDAGIIGNIWNFSIQKDSVYQLLQELEGEKVTLHYREVNRAFPWQGDTNYFVYGVEPKRE